MTASQKDKWTLRIAVFGACLSVATAIFSFYQWLISQRETRINTAIEFSKLNSAQKPDEKFREAFNLVTHGQKLNPDQATPLFFEAINLDYVAYLANVGRLDFDYLSTDLKCAIYSADFAIKELKRQRVAFDRSSALRAATPPLRRVRAGPFALQSCESRPGFAARWRGRSDDAHP